MVRPLLNPGSEGRSADGALADSPGSREPRAAISELAAVLDRAIEELVVTNPHQLTSGEYRYLADLVSSRGGCNFLVFGVGWDSVLWLWVNRGGRTLFLESSALWAGRIKAQIPSILICPVRYGTELRRWRGLLEAPPRELELALPDAVLGISWDVIFVDAPTGFEDRCPGRMKSIYTAAALARRRGGVDVVVHDCDREVERIYCDRFLGDDLLVNEFDRTRHYRTPRSTAAEQR